MNNNNNSNRGNNNRRRGRGNRQQGGGNQNRIDSRARGNAPQMLDKYRKLAQDAQHNGDRVQAEYYLQFADHYFRVIADSRPRQEDGRGQNRNDRDFSNDEDGGDEDDFDSSRNARDDRPREDRQRDERPREDRQREERPREDRPRDDRPRQDGQRGGGNTDRNRQRPPRRDNDAHAEGEPASEGEAAFEPAENPFVRPAGNREPRRTRTRTPRDNGGETDAMTGDGGEIDAAALPPSFSASAPAAEAEAESTTRKLPPRRRRKPEGEAGDGDNLTAVG